MKALKITTENPELNDRFNRILGDVVEAMDESGIRYVFIGGIASHGLGRPRSTHDIDIFVRPEDAELALRALAKHGFRTEKLDPVWLYKAYKENILVDIIFKSKGEIYLDNVMYQRSGTAEFHGKHLKLVSPEDLIIIKALAHCEATPGHWHDALAILSHATIDWDYLVLRGRRAPRRLQSLLLYALSNDVYVPRRAIDQLYDVCFGDEPVDPSPAAENSRSGGNSRSTNSSNVAGNSKASDPSRTSAPFLRPVGSQGDSNAGASQVQSGFAPAKKERVGQGASETAVRSRCVRSVLTSGPQVDAVIVAKLREHFAQDGRINELDIQIEIAEGKILLRGEVIAEERREAILKITRELLPAYDVEDQIRVPDYHAPASMEEMT